MVAPPVAKAPLQDKYTYWGEERARNQVVPRCDQMKPATRVVLRIENNVPRRRFVLLKKTGVVLERQQRPWTAGPVRSTRTYSRLTTY